MADLSLAVLIASVFTAWNAGIDGCSLRAFAFFAALCLGCIVLGSAIGDALGLVRIGRLGFPCRFLLGYLAINTLVFAQIFSVRADPGLTLLTIVAASMLWAARRGAFTWRWPERGDAPAALAVAVGLVAVTGWSLDALRPLSITGDDVICSLWTDSYVHTCHIAKFSSGASPWCDIRMSGNALPFYHYAPYAMPAAVVAGAGHTPLAGFAAFMSPCGLLLEAFAAYALVETLWGAWAGLAAVIALLLPDPWWQGGTNRLLSHHWLQQVAPGGCYGVALMAVSWMCIFLGCRERRLGLVLVSLVLLALCVLYKSHIFLANALLLWMYPAWFFPGIPWPKRTAWVVGAAAIFIAAVAISQTLASMPVIRIDGSAMRDYAATIVRFIEPSPEWHHVAQIQPDTPFAQVFVIGLAEIARGTFALMLLGCALVSACWWRIGSPDGRRPLIWVWAVVAVYLTMSLGLARETRIGGWEEFMHRPLVWAYFVVAAWTGGGLLRLLAASPLGRMPRLAAGALGAAAAAAMVLPFVCGHGMQNGPAGFQRFHSTRVPAGVWDCCAYLRERSAPQDVFHVDGLDGNLVLSALSGRQAFLTDEAFRHPRLVEPKLRRRAEIAEWLGERTAEGLRAFALIHGVRWLLLPPGSAPWPDAVLGQPEYAAHGARLYRLY